MTTLELYVKGARVWIAHQELVWEGAELLENYTPDKTALRVQTEGGEVKTLAVKSEANLPFLRNPPILIGENDLTSLSYLHEPAVLYNLQVRFCQQKDIYTYCGIVLVAINPYDDLPIYGTDTIQAYRGQAMGDLDPHIFAVAEEAYTKLEREQMDQSIIVSGESGAGKTVSAKYAMRYFATVGGSATETQIEKKVLASSPIMEAIGNAKTTRNDNSSRFGKFIELQFNKQFHISGASMRTYLLEKSRVVFQAPDERNYHIFYQLCAARKELPYLNLAEPNHFYYLNQGQSPIINGVNDFKEYNETTNALNLLGFSKEEQKEMFKILAAVLHLGNIKFTETIIEQENEQSQEGCCIHDMDKHLQKFSDLLEIESEEMLIWLCTKKIVSMRDIIMKPMTTEQAMIARDALAKHIYAQLFDWVVVTINKVLESDIPRHKFIGVLDIYGFETFEINSFEQFCINYANEKLQQQFNLHVFKLEQEEYIKEGIEWKMIDYYDNQPCIDLIETKLGILDLLDEECRMPKGSDRSWTEKLYSKCLKYSHFGKARFGTSAFIINHFADRVQYESNGFLEKNRDTVMEEHISVLKDSKNALVRKLFNEVKIKPSGAAKLKVVSAKPQQVIQKSHKKSVGSQFRDSLNLLMSTLNATTPHYVRCIKPNDTKTPFEYNPQRAVQQLRACGVLETIRLSAAGFPSRWSYIDFFYRYRVLCKFKDINRNNMQKTCCNILEQHIKDKEKFRFGKTKIFFRAGQVAYLEKLRSDKLMKCCIIMQSTVRAYLCRKKYLAMKKAIHGLQRYARGYLARRHAQELRRNRAATVIQKHIRRWLKQTKYQKIKKTIEGIQRYGRGYLARLHFKRLKYNAKATIIQKYVRGWLARRWYAEQIRKIVICQSAIRRYLARRLYKKMKIEARSIEHVKTLNKGLENKIISLQQKVDELNKNNSELRKKETEVVDLKSKLTSYRSLETEIKNLNNLLMERDRKIMELEETLKVERDEKMDILNEQEKYKSDMDEQNNRWNEEMNKVRAELDEMNEIVKRYEKEETAKEKIEHEKLLILNEQDNDRHAYQKLLQEYHGLEQHCEDLQRQLSEQNRQGRHMRNTSDVSSISQVDESLPISELPDDNNSIQSYGSLKTSSGINSGETTSNGTTDSNLENGTTLDISLVLKLQHKLSEVEREKSRLQKRLDDLDMSPRVEKAENAVRDSIKISELELMNSNLKTALYELQTSISEGNGEKKMQEQNQSLHEELERRSEEIVQLKSVLADQTSNMKSIVSTKTRMGEYINEDGELALAYETQKTINKQLELELQDEQAKNRAHEREYKVEIEKLREDNERQQRLLSEHLTTPQTKSEAYMQHEVSRLTKENLELQDKYDQTAETIRKQKKQLKMLIRKLKESGIDLDETITTDVNKNDDIFYSAKHSRALPTLRKKERDYLGMFSYKSADESIMIRHLVVDLNPRTAVTLLPGLPAYIVFMCVRHTDFINDEDKVQSLLSNFMNSIKKVVRKRKEDLETVSLWLSNTLVLLHCMKQFSGDVGFQKFNTPKQNEQCLRNFDLSEYRQVYSDLAVWIYQATVRVLEEKIQPLIVPAILEHEEIRGMSGTKPSGFSRRTSSFNLESPAGSQKPTTALLQELSNQHKVLTFYGVDNEVISQIFKQIFYFICASSLNNLLLRKELCHWSKGYNIRHNLSYFELWTKEKNMDEQAIKSTLQPIVQASHLLQARKTDDDVASVCEMCSTLTKSQICKILTLYTPVDEFEQRVPKSFIAKVQEKLLERGDNQEQDNLLMDVKHSFCVKFPFNPSSICLEDIDVPEILKLPMLEKV
ncbi:unconventional myosin-Va [Onthophagus taurus]|uniref:unconventional myosin-Va n=1 Tax=Onthophagus taurus TaxID=166361 RepID=UPI0039BDA672